MYYLPVCPSLHPHLDTFNPRCCCVSDYTILYRQDAHNSCQNNPPRPHLTAPPAGCAGAGGHPAMRRWALRCRWRPKLLLKALQRCLIMIILLKRSSMGCRRARALPDFEEQKEIHTGAVFPLLTVHEKNMRTLCVPPSPSPLSLIIRASLQRLGVSYGRIMWSGAWESGTGLHMRRLHVLQHSTCCRSCMWCVTWIFPGNGNITSPKSEVFNIPDVASSSRPKQSVPIPEKIGTRSW